MNLKIILNYAQIGLPNVKGLQFLNQLLWNLAATLRKHGERAASAFYSPI